MREMLGVEGEQKGKDKVEKREREREKFQFGGKRSSTFLKVPRFRPLFLLIR